MKIEAYPQRIIMELAFNCNLSCHMCPRHYIDKTEGFMSRDLWRRLINDVKDNSPRSIVLPFWRGEALTHPDFINLLDYALLKGIRVHISTNGTFVNGRYADILSRCEFVTFSVHNALGYKQAQDFLFLKKEGCPVIQASFVEGEKATYEIRKKLITSATLEGFDSIRVYEEHTKNGIFGKSSDKTYSARSFCPRLEGTLAIAYDGAISRCNHLWKTEETLNVNDNSIKDVWTSDIFGKIRSGYPDTRCGQCDQWIGHTRGESYSIVDGKIIHKVFNNTEALTN